MTAAALTSPAAAARTVTTVRSDDAGALLDRLLPDYFEHERSVVSALGAAEQEQLVELLGAIQRDLYGRRSDR
jgi:hypothetical protein